MFENAYCCLSASMCLHSLSASAFSYRLGEFSTRLAPKIHLVLHQPTYFNISSPVLLVHLLHIRMYMFACVHVSVRLCVCLHPSIR